MNKLRIIEWVFRWIAGGAFIYAATTKILVPCELAMDIYHYQMAPGVLINIGAIILPIVELVFGLALILGIAPRGAAMGISLTLTIFILLLSVNIVRGIDFECGCFGDIDTDICHLIAQKIQAGYPEMDRITFVRIRTACDVSRDILLLIASWSSLILMNRRLIRK